MRMGNRVRFVAEPKQVREVSIIGACDFDFWSDFLKPERLAPIRYADAAQALIMASEMTYLGATCRFSKDDSLALDDSRTSGAHEGS